MGSTFIIGEGPPGLPGEDGTPGSVWRVGATNGAPSDSLGIDGDYFLDTTYSDVYEKQAGSYVLVENLHGSVWRNGNGAPSDSLGINGDYYLNRQNGQVWFKENGAYTVILSLHGSVFRTGQGPPDDGLGLADDLYLDTWQGNVHKKEGDAYAYQTNTTGPVGGEISYGSALVVAQGNFTP